MEIVIVPNYVDECITKKLEAALRPYPGAYADYETHYQLMLRHFNNHGIVPDIEIQPPKWARENS